MYIYMYIYICMYIYTHIYIYICIYIEDIVERGVAVIMVYWQTRYVNTCILCMCPVICIIYNKNGHDGYGVYKKMGAVCYVCDACPVLPGPRPRANAYSYILYYIRIHAYTHLFTRRWWAFVLNDY